MRGELDLQDISKALDVEGFKPLDLRLEDGPCLRAIEQCRKDGGFEDFEFGEE